MNTINILDLAYETLTLRRNELKANEPKRLQRKAHAAFTVNLKRLEAEIAASPICWHNFHDATRAVFDQVLLKRFPQRNPDFISPSGSMYWRTSHGVYRLSDHWGIGIRSCDWYLRDWRGEKADGMTLAVGYCAYEHFRRDTWEVSRHWMVAPDGSEEDCCAAMFVKRGYAKRKEIVAAGIHHTYERCCAAKVAA